MNAETSRQNSAEVWYECLTISLREPPRMTVSEWANRNAYFAQSESFKSADAPARYSTEDCPMQTEPQDELTNPRVQVHVWLWASRMGKTRMWLNAAGFFIDHEPSGMMAMYPTKEDAESESKEKLQPAIDASPALRGKVSEAKGGSGDNTVTLKKFRGGYLAYVGSNSPSKLRRRAARVLFADEVDGYKASSGKEGDPLRLLFNRAKNFRRPVRILSSTPTIQGHSAIANWYEQSDQRQWFCPCVKCGEFQTLKWAQFKWPGDDRAKIRYHCEVCRHAHTEPERERMIRKGEWRATAPFSGVRGYFLPGFYSIFPAADSMGGKMHEFAEEVHSAAHSQNKRESVRVLSNTFFAQSYIEERDVKPRWQEMFDRREEYKPLPITA